jgi:uncharacterized membrane protein
VATITGFADVPFQSAGIDLRFDGPFVPQIDVPSEDNSQTVGTPLGDGVTNALATLLANAELEVVVLNPPGLSLGQTTTVLDGVTNVLQPALTAIDDQLLDLFNALGLTLGGADVTILWVGPNKPGDPSRYPLGVPSLAR